MSSPILELSTQVEPASTFTVDGEEFELLGFKHLNADQEAEVMGMLSRFDNLAMKLATSDDDRQAQSLAGRLRDRRYAIIARLTTLPEDKIKQLPLPAQVRLMRTIQQRAGLSDGDDV